MKSICVLGLGYIGLPTASVMATNGYKVLGVDVHPRVVDTVNKGNVHIKEPGLATVVAAAIQSGNLRASLRPERSEVYIIAVPTPLSQDHKADMSFVRDATESIALLLKPGDLVILESTSPPGTCRDLLVPILERGGLRVGRDIYLAHCPERVLPGQILREFIHNDRIIGGFDAASAERAREIYATFVDGQLLLTDMTSAEMAKVLENTYRDVNIALANEVALLCERLGIDFWEVAMLANRHPRVHVHQAGPGVGGHCISVDPWFLVNVCPEDAQLIQLARERNDGMPAHVVELIKDLVGAVDNPKIAVLGLAFKGNVDDVRESPSLKVIELLEKEGYRVAAHDPYAKDAPYEVQGFEECIGGADCIAVLTNHNDYKFLHPRQVGAKMRHKNLLDTRNIIPHDEWREAGFRVRLLGSGKTGPTVDTARAPAAS